MDDPPKPKWVYVDKDTHEVTLEGTEEQKADCCAPAISLIEKLKQSFISAFSEE